MSPGQGVVIVNAENVNSATARITRQNRLKPAHWKNRGGGGGVSRDVSLGATLDHKNSYPVPSAGGHTPLHSVV